MAEYTAADVVMQNHSNGRAPVDCDRRTLIKAGLALGIATLLAGRTTPGRRTSNG